MSDDVLRTHELTKMYGGVHALMKVSLTLQPGKIYGLIGQNGAGKTTLMRLIAGLAFPTSGIIELFGHNKPAEVVQARKRVGFIIETPAIQPFLSAKDNMALMRTVRGIPNPELEDELLALVGLTDVGRKRARNFSMGMKQRLGIALALIGSPELLVLDEPINGLDPVGVVEVRELLKRLCDERGMTILLSSHNLPELYQVATDYIIIDRGEIKKQVTQAELDEQCKQYLLIRCAEPERAAALLQEELSTRSFAVMPDKTIRLYDHIDAVDVVAAMLQRNGILVTGLSVEGDTLEKFYVRMIGGGQQ